MSAYNAGALVLLLAAAVIWLPSVIQRARRNAVRRQMRAEVAASVGYEDSPLYAHMARTMAPELIAAAERITREATA